MSSEAIVAYYRVSTRSQKLSGLGLQAQQDAVRRYIDAHQGKLLAEYTEVESGRNCHRPKIKEALWLCRVYDATLVIARLDRLARNTALIASLLETGVDFVAVDMPLANRFTIHILAAVAEYESRLISERTKAAFAAAKARGRTFGNPRPETHKFAPSAIAARKRSRRERAKARALDFAPLLCDLRDRGFSLSGIADQLTLMGAQTPRGGKKWRSNVVRNMFFYAGERLPKPHCRRRNLRDRFEGVLELPVVGKRVLDLASSPDV